MAYIKNLVATTLTAALMLSISGAPLAADTGSSTLLDPQASALLKKMSDYMGGLKSFTAEAFIVDEQIMGDGFKLSVLGAGSIKVQRPNKLHIAYKEMGQDREALFDGGSMLVHSKSSGMYAEVPISDGLDVDGALDLLAENLGAELPGRDLFGNDAYTPLMEPVEESTYLETVKMGDVTCRQLAFRTDEVDWQLWIQEGERPLPCRYTITSRWVYGAPQHTVTFTSWQVNPKLSANDFKLTTTGSKSTTVEKFIKSHKQAEGE